MKTLKITFTIPFLALFFLIAGCKKANDPNDEKFSHVNKELVDEFLKLPSEADQRVAYGNLSKFDKCYLWNSHFEKLMEKCGLTKEQEKIVLELKNKLNPDVFELNTKTCNDFKLMQKFYEAKFVDILGFPLAKQFLVNVNENIDNLSNHQKATQSVSASEGCGCNIGGYNFCDSGGEYYHTAYCQSGCSHPTNTGCGWFWNSPCNGICAFDHGE